MLGIVCSVCSGLYLCLIAVIFFGKEKIKSNETKLYGELIKIGILCVISEVLSYIFCNFIDGYVLLRDVSLKLVVLSFFSWIYVFSNYIFLICRTKNFEFLKKYSFIIYLIFFIILCLLPLYGMVENGKTIYSYGPCANVCYVIAFSLIFLCIVHLVFYRKHVVRKKLIPLYLFIFLGSIIVLIQFFNPSLLLISSLDIFITVIMYFTIENPDVKMIEQLELARDSADKANAAKTDFLSSMSHEIRTPLNAIVGFSDCIKHADTLDEAKENADDIMNASNTLLEIVNGILDISKIEAGKLEIVNSDYNARDLFSGLAKLVTPKMNEKGLDFQVSIADDLPNTLYGDSANLKKVVTNLLSNAYKYTDKGHVFYSVNCVNADGVCRLIISVEDSGRGIKKENVDKLFNKFQRVDEDRNTTIEGTGLGLAITKQLVELMGGNIVLHTVYGEGSRFTITLDQRIDNVIVENKVISNDTIDLNGKKLLVVDDNPLNLKVATKLLERYNATVEVCDSGFACISKITNGEKFDLILMDDMMPKMSGTETFKKLKESSSFNIPVIALTANAITGMKESYLNAGFDGYLAKPIEKDEMIRVFNRILVNNSNDNVQREVVNESSEINNNIVFLEANGIDVKHGVELLGDIAMYNDTMNDFIDEMNRRLPLLEQYKTSSDMANYAILVHAIKSDCKYLGITSLANLSYEHEVRSKVNDISFVNDNYNELINMIEDYVTICKHYLNRD